METQHGDVGHSPPEAEVPQVGPRGPPLRVVTLLLHGDVPDVDPEGVPPTGRPRAVCVGGPVGPVPSVHVEDTPLEVVAPPRRHGVVVCVVLHIDIQDVVPEGAVVGRPLRGRPLRDTQTTTLALAVPVTPWGLPVVLSTRTTGRPVRRILGTPWIVGTPVAPTAPAQPRVHADTVDTPPDVVPPRRRLSGRRPGVIGRPAPTTECVLPTQIVPVSVHVANKCLKEEPLARCPRGRLRGPGTVRDVHRVDTTREGKRRLRVACVPLGVVLGPVPVDSVDVLRGRLAPPQITRDGLRGTGRVE